MTFTIKIMSVSRPTVFRIFFKGAYLELLLCTCSFVSKD